MSVQDTYAAYQIIVMEYTGDFCCERVSESGVFHQFRNFFPKFRSENFSLSSPIDPGSKKDRRGYQELYNASGLVKIQAYMLTDGLHPLITLEVLKTMSDNGLDGKILYDSLAYNLHIWIENDEGQCPVK